METTPLFTFTSHIAGKNAKVEIFRDRIEWAQPRGISVGKITAGLATGGLSLLATGVKNGKAGTEMIPVRSITSVTTKRDGLLNTIVSVVTSGNTIDFRVSHNEAAEVRSIVSSLILGGGASAAAAAAAAASVSAPTPPAPAAAAAAALDAVAEIQRFAELHKAGILSNEEFSAKKTKLLGV